MSDLAIHNAATDVNNSNILEDAVKEITPTVTAAINTISYGSYAIQNAGSAVYSFGQASWNLLATAASGFTAIGYTAKALLTIPSYISHTYSSDDARDTLEYETQDPAATIRSDLNNAATHFSNTANSAMDTACASYKFACKGVECAKNTAYTLGYAGKTIVNAAIVTKNALGYGYSNAVVPTATMLQQQASNGYNYLRTMHIARQEKLYASACAAEAAKADLSLKSRKGAWEEISVQLNSRPSSAVAA